MRSRIRLGASSEPFGKEKPESMSSVTAEYAKGTLRACPDTCEPFAKEKPESTASTACESAVDSRKSESPSALRCCSAVHSP